MSVQMKISEISDTTSTDSSTSTEIHLEAQNTKNKKNKNNTPQPSPHNSPVAKTKTVDDDDEPLINNFDNDDENNDQLLLEHLNNIQPPKLKNSPKPKKKRGRPRKKLKTPSPTPEPSEPSSYTPKPPEPSSSTPKPTSSTREQPEPSSPTHKQPSPTHESKSQPEAKSEPDPPSNQDSTPPSPKQESTPVESPELKRKRSRDTYNSSVKFTHFLSDVLVSLHKRKPKVYRPPRLCPKRFKTNSRIGCANGEWCEYIHNMDEYRLERHNWETSRAMFRKCSTRESPIDMLDYHKLFWEMDQRKLINLYRELLVGNTCFCGKACGQGYLPLHKVDSSGRKHPIPHTRYEHKSKGVRFKLNFTFNQIESIRGLKDFRVQKLSSSKSKTGSIRSKLGMDTIVLKQIPAVTRLRYIILWEVNRHLSNKKAEAIEWFVTTFEGFLLPFENSLEFLRNS